MGYDDIAQRMDDAVYLHLGNDILYAKSGGAFKLIKGVLILASEAENQDLNYLDPLNHIDRVKVSKAIIPVPTSADRIKHQKLPAVMRPKNWTSVTDGRDWLIELQKA